MTPDESHTAFEEADTLWHLELVQAFGDGAYIARYEQRGRGNFENDLGAAYRARMAAFATWEARRRA